MIGNLLDPMILLGLKTPFKSSGIAPLAFLPVLCFVVHLYIEVMFSYIWLDSKGPMAYGRGALDSASLLLFQLVTLQTSSLTLSQFVSQLHSYSFIFIQCIMYSYI